MSEVFNFFLPFLATTKSYEDVLRKLAGFAFYETYFLTLLLRDNEVIGSFARRLESQGTVGQALSLIPGHEFLNISGLALAIFVSIFSFAIQFHDRLSDLFGIRYRFDRDEILVPLAEGVGVVVTSQIRRRITEERKPLMRSVFYKFASSRADAPIVDKHDIEHALTAWSWLWVLVEATAYFLIAGVVAWIFGSGTLGLILAIVAFATAMIGFLQRARLGHYARPQREAILEDSQAVAHISQVFRAL